MNTRIKIAVLCATSAIFVLSGQACPPDANMMMPAPQPQPQPQPPVAGDGVLVNGTVVSLDTDFTDGLYWKLDGNAGTTAGTNFLGTTDNEPLELFVNGACALRLEPTANCPNLIGGFNGNSVTSGVVAATIAGGGPTDPNDASTSNDVRDNFGTIGGGGGNVVGNDDDGDPTQQEFATVGGGRDNIAGGAHATIGGGRNNSAEGLDSAVGGGDGNVAAEERCTVAGGFHNDASGRFGFVGGGQVNNASGFSATIGGGTSNIASGDYATVAGGQSNEATTNLSFIGGGRDNRAEALLAMVPGGFQCHATGFVSFAAGYNARAVHDGAFVWTDTAGIPVPFSSTAEDQFLIRAAGGVGINTNTPQGALHTQAPDDDTADLVLGGTVGDDNGLITSDLTLPSSDINVFSNGGVGIKLDSNSDETNALFLIADGNEDLVFAVGESGVTGVIELNASEKVSAESFEAEDDLGATNAPDVGGVYSDNVVYAWADVQFNGTVVASFGCTVSKQASGLYRVTFKRQLPNGVSAVVTVKTLNDPVIATAVASQSFADVSTKVFNGSAFVSADNAFYIQVVGRP